VAVTLALLPLAGCGDDGGYDDEVEAQFMSQCRAEAEQDPEAFVDPEAFCGCTYERIREDVAFEDFTEIDQAFSDFSAGVETTAPTLPSDLNAARINCFVDSQGAGASTSTSAAETTTSAAP